MATVEERLTLAWETAPNLLSRIATVDHKELGKRYLVTAFAFLVLGGVAALVMRAQLAGPEQRLLSPDLYNQLFTMHGTTMMLLYASPVLTGFGVYLVPLMIGARDLVFPRLNAFTYWSFVFSGAFMYASFFIGAAPDGGWFAYVPLTGREYSPGPNIDFYALGLLFLGISTTGAAINAIVTILKVRAPGMSINRMPLFLWSTLTTSVAMVFALPSLSAALIFLELDRLFGAHIYDPGLGGDPLLWQHLFWAFAHPWVYIVFLPATGIISMVLPVFSRRPIIGYNTIALATVATGLIGFGVWVHHMFAAGLHGLSMSFFSAASMTVTIPSAIQVFAWIATLWYGRPRLATPMLFALGFLVLFTIGGLSGVMTAVIPFDWQVTDTYFVVAHLHYVLVGANVFPVFAGLYYWFPKMTGRLLDERLGRWNFWLMFVGFNLGFFPMHVAGLLGMPRRVYTYEGGIGWSAVNLIETIGVTILALGILVFFVNLIRSRRHGERAGGDPWDANTLEWATSSPPPVYNFRAIPVVHGRDPLWHRLPGSATAEGEKRGRTPAPEPEQRGFDLAEGRELLETSVLDGEPEAVVRVPRESLTAPLLALALAVAFVGLLTELPWLAALGALASAALIAAWLWPGHAERVA